MVSLFTILFLPIININNKNKKISGLYHYHRTAVTHAHSQIDLYCSCFVCSLRHRRAVLFVIC